ncbi:MAG: C10 family peptidase, partial [Muribaculaceae bacterium]|nr:C10 family peptidase [Muribaculaceae bacterium]
MNRLQHRQNLSWINRSNNTPQFRISKILTDSCGNNTVYLFDSEDGFVVSPADDTLPALLGYGDGKMYDSNGNLPIGFREWLQYMSRCVSAISAEGNPVTCCTSAGEAIAPLCSTSWGQNEPFNLECPEYNGEKCLSGCVATAMAQVMKYHNWPPQGRGELEYRAGKIGTEIYTDFSRYIPDWDNMLDDYSAKSATEQQRQAVARLMRGLGGSVRMNYFPTASGADVNDATRSLLEYWDYSEDIRYMRRSWFT